MPKNRHTIFIAKASFATLLLVVGFFSFFGFAATVLASAVSAQEVVALANASRQKEGLAPLVLNQMLSAAAEDKALDMLKHDYFAHTSPQGVEPWAWFKKEGYGYKYAGENLAINYTSAKEQHAAWMQSATHRANILNIHYQEIGVATVEGKINGESSLVTVELFGTPLVPVVIDQPRSVTSVPAPIAIEAVLPEVKGTEIIASPYSAPLAPELESTVTNDARLSLAWTKTYAQKIRSVLGEKFAIVRERLSQVEWNFVLRVNAVVFLMLALLVGPAAFLYKAIVIIVQTLQEKKTVHTLLPHTADLSRGTLGILHQHLKEDTHFIQDIRHG
jgi:uncharacterized protein YkwD